MYKGQGRNQRELMTRAYWEFLVHGKQLQAPIPITKEIQRVARTSRPRTLEHVDSFSVARVRPRTSKGITDLLLLNLVRLDAACPSKKISRRRQGFELRVRARLKRRTPFTCRMIRRAGRIYA